MESIKNQQTADPQKQYKRRRVLIDAATQGRWALSLGLVVFLVSTIMSSILYLTLHQQARMRMIDPGGYTTSVVGVVIGAGLAFGLLTAIATALWSLFMTHRVLGPLYVMRGFLESVKAGSRPTTMRPLRRNDEFKDFYATLFDTIAALDTRQRRQLSLLTNVLRAAHSIPNSSTGERTMEKMVQNLKSLRDEIASSAGATGGSDVEFPADHNAPKREDALSDTC